MCDEVEMNKEWEWSSEIWVIKGVGRIVRRQSIVRVLLHHEEVSFQGAPNQLA
jgi:hypothetical protein